MHNIEQTNSHVYLSVLWMKMMNITTAKGEDSKNLISVDVRTCFGFDDICVYIYR